MNHGTQRTGGSCVSMPRLPPSCRPIHLHILRRWLHCWNTTLWSYRMPPLCVHFPLFVSTYLHTHLDTAASCLRTTQSVFLIITLMAGLDSFYAGRHCHWDLWHRGPGFKPRHTQETKLFTFNSCKSDIIAGSCQSARCKLRVMCMRWEPKSAWWLCLDTGIS